MTKILLKQAVPAVVMLATLLGVLFITFSSVVFKWQFNIVLSGSMDPTLKVGGMVAVQPVDAKTIEVGDIITFSSPEYGKTVVHRVIEKQQGSQLYFRTQGDANGKPDASLVPAQNVVGKVRFHVPVLGKVLQFPTTRLGRILLLVLPGIMLLGMEMKNISAKLFRLRKGKKEAVGVVASPVRQGWTTGLRTEEWLGLESIEA